MDTVDSVFLLVPVQFHRSAGGGFSSSFFFFFRFLLCWMNRIALGQRC